MRRGENRLGSGPLEPQSNLKDLFKKNVIAHCGFAGFRFRFQFQISNFRGSATTRCTAFPPAVARGAAAGMMYDVQCTMCMCNVQCAISQEARCKPRANLRAKAGPRPRPRPRRKQRTSNNQQASASAPRPRPPAAAGSRGSSTQGLPLATTCHKGTTAAFLLCWDLRRKS
jgi:hypothetical protein